MHNGVATVENSLAAPPKVNTELPCGPAIPLGIYPKEQKMGVQTQSLYIRVDVPGSTTHNSQKRETSING